MEQVKQFNYLGCEFSLGGEPDFDKKIKKINGFQRICGTIRKYFKKNMYRHPMKFYKVVPALLYGSEKR